ncbi:MAG TPA: hypothetical protein VE871_06085 [Longimicrobium sp.]|nr:hypothetical protein [Longimicrobium sp.]
MKKIRLDVQELRVESFQVRHDEGARATVNGYLKEGPVGVDSGDTAICGNSNCGYETCAPSCGSRAVCICEA